MVSKSTKKLSRIVGLGVLLLGGSSGATAEDLHILATGVFATSLRDLQASFRASSGANFQANISNAGKVSAKLMAGEPADVVMTSAAGIDALARQGKLDGSSKVEVGHMRLGLGVRTGATIRDLESSGQIRESFLRAPAVAYIDPRGGATAGTFSEAVFKALEIEDAVHAKAVLCEDGADVVAALVSGKATIGMAQASEIIGSPGVGFAGYLPESLNVVTVYAAATVGTNPRKSAKAFLRFLQSPSAVERFRLAGWD